MDATERVRLYKAHENANGTFPIGKTCTTEELSDVENYVHLNATSDEGAQRKRLTSNVGSTVAI